jgi:hypothetical protein
VYTHSCFNAAAIIDAMIPITTTDLYATAKKGATLYWNVRNARYEMLGTRKSKRTCSSCLEDTLMGMGLENEIWHTRMRPTLKALQPMPQMNQVEAVTGMAGCGGDAERSSLAAPKPQRYRRPVELSREVVRRKFLSIVVMCSCR